MAPEQRLIFALDVPTAERAFSLVEALSGHVGCFKIGLELFIACGPELVRQIAGRAPVFLDLKLHDIPATVGRAAAMAEALKVSYLTVHPGQDAVKAAVQAAPNVEILMVTVLTSISAEEIADAGAGSLSELVVARARRAASWGCRGVICSGHEVEAVRQAVDQDLLLVTPGVRPTGSARGDQARVVTPAEAIARGADKIVVGRPIRDAADPVSAAAAIVDELKRG